MRRLAIAGALPHTVVCQGARKTTRRYPRRFADEFAASGLDTADLAAFAAAWRARVTVTAYVAAPVFLAVITDQVIAVIRQHILPLDAESAWAPLGRAAVAVLRLAAVLALYLLRTVLAPSGTLRGLRQIVLDAVPVPGTTGVRTVCGEPIPRLADDHGIPEYEFERPAEAKAGDQGAGQRVIRVRTKKAAFLSRYRAHPEYGNRSAAGRVATELAPLAGLQAGTGRTYIAEELRKLTDLAARPRSTGEGNDQPAG
jgi:hypothetical protein